MKTINKTKLVCALGVIGIIALFFTSCIVTEEFMNELLYGTGGTGEMASAQEENNTGSELGGNISGTYFSENWGEIVLIQRDNQVTGTFPNGTIEGTLTGNTLEGRWAGPWVAGRMRLNFSSDASSFSGYEAYGNLEPEANNTDARPWSGTRIGSLPDQGTKTQELVSPPTSDKSTATTASSTESSSAFNATGVYRTSLGELTLTQNGSTVTGSYPQSTLTGQMSGYELTGQIYSLGTTADIRFTFASDGSGFQGEMLYQGESHVWNGTKISGNATPQKDVATKQSEMNTKQTSPLSVSGTYYSKNWGEIVLEQRGEHVSGTYPNGIIAGTLTGNTLAGTWESPWTRGRMILRFSPDASNFSGYENTGSLEPNASNPDSLPWTGIRTGSSPQGSTGTETTQYNNADQFDNYYGGWIDVNEDNSGFVFGADTSLLLFFDGEIAEGYWTTKGKNITLFVENAQGDYVTFEGTYEFDGTNLLLTLDGDELVLERHWVSDKDDVISFNNQFKTETPVQSGSIVGVYDTNFGKMTLTQRGSSVTGEYPMGEVEGTFSNNTFTGTFSSMGITGTFNLVFTTNGDAFEGKMVVDKYTDYLWTGTRISSGEQSSSPTTKAVPTQSTQSSYTVGMKGPAGGLIFYDKGEFSNGWRYLELAPQGAEMTKMWAPNNEMTAGVFDVDDAVGKGEDYTGKIVSVYANITSGNDYAAQACESLSYGGFNDWFLPSQTELVEIYNKVHKEGLGGFTREMYWSSTEWKDGSNSYAYYLNFNDGSQYVSSKMDSLKVRPVRAF